MTAKYAPFTIYLKAEEIGKDLEPGFRHSVVKWRLTEKQEKEGKTARHPVMVAVPAIKLNFGTEHCLYSVMSAAINDLQDAMVAEAVNAILKTEPTAKIVGTVLDIDLSEAGIAAWHAEKQMNGRLSGDAIGKWFDEALHDNLGAHLIERGLIGDGENEKLKAIMVDFRAKFVKLASPKATMAEPLVLQLQKAIALAEDDKVKTVLTAKLAGFLKPAEDAIAINL